MLSVFVLYTICISFPALLSQMTRNLLASSKGNTFSQGSGDQQLEVKVSGGCALPPAAPGRVRPASSSSGCRWSHVATVSAFALLSLITTLVTGFRAHPDDLGDLI